MPTDACKHALLEQINGAFAAEGLPPVYSQTKLNDALSK
jgi:hypothetical protein